MKGLVCVDSRTAWHAWVQFFAQSAPHRLLCLSLMEAAYLPSQNMLNAFYKTVINAHQKVVVLNARKAIH